MTRILQQGLVLASVLVLSACGGSDGNYVAGNGGGGSTTTTNPSTSAVRQLEVAASSRQLGSSGAEPVTISAVAKDGSNNVLKGVAVTFSVNNDATIEADSTTAGSSVKTARLTPGLNNPENRTVTVTATAEGKVSTLDVEVTGTTLQLDGPARIVINTPTTFTAKLKDSSGNGLAYQTVLFASSLGSSITPVSGSGFTTDAKGEIQFKLQSAQAGTDNVTANALGASFSKSVEISGDEFTLSSPKAEISVNAAEQVSLLWKKNGVAQSGKTINLTATRGVLPLQVQTDAQGKATFSITSSTAGGSVITATDASSGLTATLTKEFVAIAPSYLNVQTEQAVISPGDSVSIVAHVRDINDNPVKNQVVSFNVNDTVTGVLSSSLATTDSLGRATVVYTAGDATSAKDGVVIQTFLPANPSITDSVSLTVGNRALRLVLGHDENLQEDDVYYKQTFGVIVTDSNGNAIAGKRVNFSIVPLAYYKGMYECPTPSEGWGVYSSVTCGAEDQDRDGWLDTGEDFNGNGALEPTHSVSVTPAAVTDADGKVSVDITYPQSEAQWSHVRLTATIVDAGTEFSESSDFDLGVTASDVSSCDIAPPNRVSPYGVALDCASPY